MTVAYFTVGHDVRHWTQFRVDNATPEELEALGDIESERAVDMAEKLLGEKRAYIVEVTHDDSPDHFHSDADPVVIEFEEQS